MRKQNYEVRLVAYSTVVVVGAESDEQAIEFAINEVNSVDFEIDETEVMRQITSKDLAHAKELANCVSEN